MSINHAIQRAAQQSRHKTAVRGAGFERSWQVTADRIARLAGGLIAVGLARGDRLALLAGNCVEHMELTHAAIWAGIVVVPINTRLAQAEVEQILDDSGARAIAYNVAFAALGAGVATTMGLDWTISLHPDAVAQITFDQLLTADPVDAVNPAGDDLLGLYYTGGTTGLPKGVALSHQTFHLTATDQATALECNSESVYLHAAPYFHLADCTLGNSVTYAQGTHVFVDDLSSQGVLNAIRDHGVNFVSLVPTQYQDLIDKHGDDQALKRVTNAAYGAAPISEGLLKRVVAALPNARLKQCYGQTEIGGACVILPPEAHVPGNARLATAGKATLSAHVRIVDGNGNEVSRGTAGEIVIAGPRVMLGYWGLPEKTAETVVDGWLHTGDVGVMDDDGYVAVVDRLKDMIVTGGENVFCAEVENAVSTHPLVAAVSAVGVPDDRWGEAVHVFVIPIKGQTPAAADILTHTRARLAGYKTPKGVTFIDAFPISGVGKVRKDLLRAMWTKTHSRSA